MSKPQVSKVRAFLLAIIFAGAQWSPASHAQDRAGEVMVNVPFAFQNGSQHLSAGLYTISISYQNIARIRGQSRSGFAMTGFDEDVQPSKTTRVVFRKYGDQYFLDEIWVAGDTNHTYFLPSKSERLEMSANRTAPTSVMVAALEGIPLGQLTKVLRSLAVAIGGSNPCRRAPAALRWRQMRDRCTKT
jgi:hypothetical protein